METVRYTCQLVYCCVCVCAFLFVYACCVCIILVLSRMSFLFFSLNNSYVCRASTAVAAVVEPPTEDEVMHPVLRRYNVLLYLFNCCNATQLKFPRPEEEVSAFCISPSLISRRIPSCTNAFVSAIQVPSPSRCHKV